MKSSIAVDRMLYARRGGRVSDRKESNPVSFLVVPLHVFAASCSANSTVENGRIEVRIPHQEATLVCDDGYRSQNHSVSCIAGTWYPVGKCESKVSSVKFCLPCVCHH